MSLSYEVIIDVNDRMATPMLYVWLLHILFVKLNVIREDEASASSVQIDDPHTVKSCSQLTPV